MPPASSIPILLLKSPSQPPETDSYTRLFSDPSSTYSFNPIHVPVLTHAYNPKPLIPLLSDTASFPYGGLIFTSQRAVSAFSLALSQTNSSALREWSLPIYAVGPATTKAVKAICAQHLPCCMDQVLGEDAGTGEALAQIVLRNYNERWQNEENSSDSERKARKPLLFLTGEKHRDIIPRMLQSPFLPEKERIVATEMVVYSTAAMDTFEGEFKRVLDEIEQAGVRWIIIFSATGGEGMLKALGWYDAKTGMVKDDFQQGRSTFVASIGPTTREYLRKEFAFEVDVCAEKPSPNRVKEGIEAFMINNGITLNTK